MGKMYMMKPYRYVAVTVLLFSLGNVAHGQPVAPSPRTILEEMIATYARVTSYQDSGAVRTLSGDPALIADSESSHLRGVSSRDDTLVSFKTYYARSGKFRFEWRSPLLRVTRDAAVWSDGKQAYSWTPDTTGVGESFILNKGLELRWYVDEAQRWSGGAVFFVSSLLMKDVS